MSETQKFIDEMKFAADHLRNAKVDEANIINLFTDLHNNIANSTLDKETLFTILTNASEEAACLLIDARNKDKSYFTDTLNSHVKDDIARQNINDEKAFHKAETREKKKLAINSMIRNDEIIKKIDINANKTSAQLLLEERAACEANNGHPYDMDKDNTYYKYPTLATVTRMLCEPSNLQASNSENVFLGIKKLATEQYDNVAAYNNAYFIKLVSTEPKNPIGELKKALIAVINPEQVVEVSSAKSANHR